MKTSRLVMLTPLVVLGLLLTALPLRVVQADAGPKPSMRFTFVGGKEPAPTIVSGQLLECEDEACTEPKPLEQLGPQRFACEANACHTIAYHYSPYHRLEIEFSDGVTRASNVFAKNAFAARYLVTVHEQNLTVEEQVVGPKWPFLKHSPTFLDLLASVVFPCMAIILPVVLVGLAVQAGRAGATFATCRIWLVAAWILAIPATLAGIQWTQGLIITLVVELLLGAVYVLWRKRPALVVLTVILLLNLITQPALWVTVSRLGELYAILLALGAEMVVWLVEAVGLYLSQRSRIKFLEALVVSFVLNAASFLVGSLLPL